jgi:hypothetical protein
MYVAHRSPCNVNVDDKVLMENFGLSLGVSTLRRHFSFARGADGSLQVPGNIFVQSPDCLPDENHTN